LLGTKAARQPAPQRRRGRTPRAAHLQHELRLRQQQAGEEGAQRQGQAAQLGQQRGAQHHQQGGGGKNLGVVLRGGGGVAVRLRLGAAKPTKRQGSRPFHAAPAPLQAKAQRPRPGAVQAVQAW
jgi:hypothetical protein